MSAERYLIHQTENQYFGVYRGSFAVRENRVWGNRFRINKREEYVAQAKTLSGVVDLAVSRDQQDTILV